MKKRENIAGFLLLLIVLVLGKGQLESPIFFRLVMGIGLGYTLSRAYTGFAGSVNRAVSTGSTKLMRTLMFMFVITAALSAALLYGADATEWGLWVNPINLGLILGGILFGFGMAFSSCCASGVLTDLITGLPRALVTLIFFSFGVFIAFPLESKAWVANSWFSTETGAAIRDGVFLPDWFKWDGMNGYLGALVLTAIFAGIVVVLSNKYEAKRKEEGTYTGHFMENIQAEQKEFNPEKDYAFPTESTYERIFVQPWSLRMGAVVLAILFTTLMAVTKSGWGASTPYGFWFGRVLRVFGVSADSLASFTGKPIEPFTMPFFSHPVYVQNFGILIGTAVYLLTAGKFKDTFMSEMHLTGKEAALYAMGGLAMGVGTRLANGCNVGALYTPIANFSLSGWVFLIAMVIGGSLGHKFGKKVGY